MKEIKTLQLKKDYPFSEKIVNIPGGPSLSNYEMYDRIIRTLDSSKRFEKYLVWDVGNIQLISLVPSIAIDKLVTDQKYSAHYFYEEIIYSLIVGFFIIKEANREFRIFGTPEQLLTCYKSFARYHDLTHDYDPGFHDVPVFYEHIFPKFNQLLTFVKTNLDLPTSIATCQKCGIILSELSTIEIEISNSHTNLESAPNSICCPICSNSIELNKPESDLISSIPLHNTYRYLNPILHDDIPIPMKIALHEGFCSEVFLRANSAFLDSICHKYYNIPSQMFFKVMKCFPKRLYYLLEPLGSEYQQYMHLETSEIIKEAFLQIRKSKVESLREAFLNYTGGKHTYST